MTYRKASVAVLSVALLSGLLVGFVAGFLFDLVLSRKLAVGVGFLAGVLGAGVIGVLLLMRRETL